MRDFCDCAQKKEKKNQKKKKKQKESKCFYMITSVFSRRYESYMM